MLKHIITTECHRRCPYCLVRKLHTMDQSLNGGYTIHEVEAIYRELRQVHRSIMFTGGEPTLHRGLQDLVSLAYRIFEGVHLTTAHIKGLQWAPLFDSVTYSLHGDTPPELPNTLGVVYASIMADQYSPSLPLTLAQKGYAGLSINEEQRSGMPFTCDLPEIEGFSIRVNHRGHCLDETIILPDLSVIRDFRPYL